MTTGRRLFRSLLFLYPAAYRAQFAGEMIALFELRMMTCGNRARFLASEIAGLIAGAARERFTRRRELLYAGADIDGRRLPNDVVHARLRVDSAVQKMVFAISHHRFEEARRLSIEERIEREKLRRVCDSYGIDAI